MGEGSTEIGVFEDIDCSVADRNLIDESKGAINLFPGSKTGLLFPFVTGRSASVISMFLSVTTVKVTALLYEAESGVPINKDCLFNGDGYGC